MPTIQLDHPVLFRALENTVESTVKDDIEAFHTELLEVSTVYARSVKKATSQKPVVVTVTHQPLAGGAAAHPTVTGRVITLTLIRPSSSTMLCCDQHRTRAITTLVKL